jgi:serine/threonine-protein kinase
MLHCALVDDPRIGRVVAGRYKLLSQLAEGGMGVVYRAERVGIGRPVVVKFLHAMLSDKAGIVDRFEREARASALLNHPNCVALVDFGLDDGSPFLVMELAEGRTLADLLDHGPIAPARAVKIIMQVLAGLSHAHARGVLHRDLKPANVMIIDAAGTEDFVKIVDFGLAKMVGPVASAGKDVTVEGIAIGTPGYMSPEQAAGIPSDRRADIYCTGALLYHMVTGAKAFEGDDLHSVLRRHREETPISPAAVVPQVKISMPLEDVILRAMKREPSERYQSADDMYQALRKTPEARAAEEMPPPRRAVSTPRLDDTRAEMPSSRSRSKKRSGNAVAFLLLGGLAGAAVSAGAIWYLRPDTEAVASKPAEKIPEKQPEKIPEKQPEKIPEKPPEKIPEKPPEKVLVVPSPTPAPVEDAKEDDGSNEDERTPPQFPVEVVAKRDSQVRTVADAKKLLKHGDPDDALAGLLKLQHQRPAGRAGAEIAQLIGNLYFDRKWWTDSLRQYRFAINLDGHAKSDSILIGNTIRTLGDKATYPRARKLLVSYIGKSAIPALKRATRNGSSPLARKNAQAVLSQIESHHRR